MSTVQAYMKLTLQVSLRVTTNNGISAQFIYCLIAVHTESAGSTSVFDECSDVYGKGSWVSVAACNMRQVVVLCTS